MEIDPGQAIPVQSVRQEYEIVAMKRCDCEGQFQVVRQSLLVHEGSHYDLLEVACRQCARQGSFLFRLEVFGPGD
jgi:hypothetical protein